MGGGKARVLLVAPFFTLYFPLVLFTLAMPHLQFVSLLPSGIVVVAGSVVYSAALLYKGGWGSVCTECVSPPYPPPFPPPKGR